MNIIFDLDGTLIDSSERLYKLFNHLVPESKLTKEEYWDLKRNKINHQMIIDKYFPNIYFDDFNNKWMELIEDPEYLDMDACYKDTTKVLNKLKEKYNIYLLTARQSKSNLIDELKRLNIINYFDEILVTENKLSKGELLKENLNRLGVTNKDFFISDMGKDILIGNKYNLKTVAISHGFMNKDNLLTYNPKYCIDDLSEIIDLI